jgi:hypothetical protein
MDRVRPSRNASQSVRGSAAERDAAAILARAEQDERAAETLRDQLQATGLRPMPGDELIRPHLAPHEEVVAMRQAVVEHVNRDGAARAWTARLYLTTQRLILLNREPFSVRLVAIDEILVSGERILLTLDDGTGMRIDAGSPRVLRVQLAAARASAAVGISDAREAAIPEGQPDSR